MGEIPKLSLLEKSQLGLLKAKPGFCEEQVPAPWGQGGVVPCSLPAPYKVEFSGEGKFNMCLHHAEHSVKNRKARYCTEEA